jgi:hypothetical protein
MLNKKVKWGIIDLLPIGLTPKDTTSRRAWVRGCLPPYYPWGFRSQPDRQYRPYQRAEAVSDHDQSWKA